MPGGRRHVRPRRRHGLGARDPAAVDERHGQQLGVDRRHGTRRYRRVPYRSRRRRLPACAASPWASPQPSPSPPATSRLPPRSPTSPRPTPASVKTFRPDGTAGRDAADDVLVVDRRHARRDRLGQRRQRRRRRPRQPHRRGPLHDPERASARSCCPHGEVAFWPGRNGIRDPCSTRSGSGSPTADPQAAAAAGRRRHAAVERVRRHGAARGDRERQRRRPVPVRRLAARPQGGEDEAPDHRPQVALARAAQRRRRGRLHARARRVRRRRAGRPTSCC